mgnify:CR=1 FL=1
MISSTGAAKAALSRELLCSEEELAVMKDDIAMCRQLGVAGVVSGVLNRDGTIDESRTKCALSSQSLTSAALRELIENAGSLSFTFHRAIDMAPDPLQAIDAMMRVGGCQLGDLCVTRLQEFGAS